jgi:uncharacterized phiE125 gp8 family phage protein
MFGPQRTELTPVLIAAPEAEPVTLDQVKAQLNILHDDDDDYLDSLISIARSFLDGPAGVFGRALISQSWQQDFSTFTDCTGRRQLAVGPVQSITTVKYYDAANVLQTLSASVYALYADELGPYLALAPGPQSWPALYCRPDAVRVTYVAGFGDDPEDIPANILHLVNLLVAHWYAQREPVNVGNITSELPFTVKALIDLTRRVGF